MLTGATPMEAPGR